ncbi:MAG: CoA pyrophosphatase [Beijerinckiaceae bacterium]|nr:CoA pyrophosphatase [Beijerinckiaceae bacterium]
MSQDNMSAPSYCAQDLAQRARARLCLELPHDVFTHAGPPSRGDYHLNAWPDPPPPPGKPAAVLVGIVMRPAGATILLTQRRSTLRSHAGQIAFPGGRIDPQDADPLAAALREAHEEIALTSSSVTPLGYLDAYQTGTGYRVVPVVALVCPPFDLTLCEAEVEDVFETPLDFLMNPVNHQIVTREHDGRRFYAMTYGERYIWGATAGMLRNLYERLYL